MTKDQTQGRRLIALLKKRGMSTLDMQMKLPCTCPWKRIDSALKKDEQLLKTKRYPADGRWYYVYRVVAKKPCN